MPTPKDNRYLDEAGVIISTTHIITPSHRFAIRNIKNATLIRAKPATLKEFFFKYQRPYQLLINDFKTTVMVLETSDKAFMLRLNDALGRAKDTHHDNKKLVRNS